MKIAVDFDGVLFPKANWTRSWGCVALSAATFLPTPDEIEALSAIERQRHYDSLGLL